MDDDMNDDMGDAVSGSSRSTAETVSWSDFEGAAPDLARRVRARMESHRHVVMATLRPGGAPRLSGMEAPIRSGHLWLAMTPGSLKARDLHRDPRFALHSAPDSERLPAGDARISGVGVSADASQQAEFVAGHRYPVEDPSIMELFVARIRRAALVRVEDDHLLIEAWTPSGGLVQVTQ
ncbi:MAG: pyridoxamine 5'-phosphate oxidase family protein [Acidimicrobiaceae bacterium]|nr:pyridoxamine 5'-phosphate oxidase family protein [Acidimicrobiaceae bacterium]MCY4279145.1 pyridoxamine 5'-phosphate oxidase family protein [Acidimicrobiaceae bacterium]